MYQEVSHGITVQIALPVNNIDEVFNAMIEVIIITDMLKCNLNNWSYSIYKLDN